MQIGQLEQKLLHGNHVSTDGRQRLRQRRRRQNHNIIRPQKFCGRIKSLFVEGLTTQKASLVHI